MTPDITIVTRDAAAAESLSDEDYRDIYNELRSKTTLREFAHGGVIHSDRSFAWWSKYERGDARLARADKNALRRAVGLPELPLSVEEAINQISPDAVVYRVGADQLADKIVIIADPDPLTIYLDGALTILPESMPSTSSTNPPQTPAVTPVTAPTTNPDRHLRPESQRLGGNGFACNLSSCSSGSRSLGTWTNIWKNLKRQSRQSLS